MTQPVPPATASPGTPPADQVPAPTIPIVADVSAAPVQQPPQQPQPQQSASVIATPAEGPVAPQTPQPAPVAPAPGEVPAQQPAQQQAPAQQQQTPQPQYAQQPQPTQQPQPQYPYAPVPQQPQQPQPPAAPALLLECRGLTKTYGSSAGQALNAVNLQIGKGKIVGLLGPNGSGKTTLIKLINGLLVPTSGEILINGHPPGPESRMAISYLPDKTYLADWMRIEQIVDLFADFYTDFDKARAYDMLQRLHINPKAVFKTLSKGNKEKVQLILVMSRRAQLYLLDEPIGGVDPAARDFILQTIVSNYSPEATIIIATHLIADIETVLNEVVLISQGFIVAHDTVENIRATRGQTVDQMFRQVFAC